MAEKFKNRKTTSISSIEQQKRLRVSSRECLLNIYHRQQKSLTQNEMEQVFLGPVSSPHLPTLLIKFWANVASTAPKFAKHTTTALSSCHKHWMWCWTTQGHLWSPLLLLPLLLPSPPWTAHILFHTPLAFPHSNTCCLQTLPLIAT